MITMIQNVVRLRNPSFQLDSDVNIQTLMVFIWESAWSVIRGFGMFFYFKNPRGAMFKTGVRFTNLSKIKWGRFLKLGTGVYVSALTKNGVDFGNNVSIGDYSRVVVSTSLKNQNGYIKIGDNVGIGEFAYLGGGGGLEIGNDCIVGQYFSCHPENHNYSDDSIPIRLQGVSHKGIKVGDNCWIGSKVTLLDGVQVGNGCIIAAGSVVTKSFPDNHIIAGVPAKILKQRNEYN